MSSSNREEVVTPFSNLRGEKERGGDYFASGARKGSERGDTE